MTDTLDDLDTEAARLNSVTGNLDRLLQDLHAGISRRDWHATEVAANAIRDRFTAPWRPTLDPDDDTSEAESLEDAWRESDDRYSA